MKNIRIGFSDKKHENDLEKVKKLVSNSESNNFSLIQDIFYAKVKNYLIFKHFILFKKNEIIIFTLSLNKKISNIRTIKYTDFDVEFYINPAIVEILIHNKMYYIVISSRIRPIDTSFFWTIIYNIMSNKYFNEIELRNSLLEKLQSGNILKKYSLVLGYYFLNSYIRRDEKSHGFLTQNEMYIINNEIIFSAILQVTK